MSRMGIYNIYKLAHLQLDGKHLQIGSLCLFPRRGQPPPFCSGSCIFHNRMVCHASKTLQIGGVFNTSNLTGDDDSQQNGNKIKLTTICSNWKNIESYNRLGSKKEASKS